MIRACALSCK